MAPVHGDFSAVGLIAGGEMKLLGEDVEDFPTGDDFAHVPAIGLADVHVFDKTEIHGGLAGPAGEGEDLTLVHAALDDGVDLDGEAEVFCGHDAGEDAVDFGSGAVHFPENFWVEGVE